MTTSHEQFCEELLPWKNSANSLAFFNAAQHMLIHLTVGIPALMRYRSAAERFSQLLIMVDERANADRI